MEYPFGKCLHPRKVFNKYTRQQLVVGCGKCAACINSKSSSMSLQTCLESVNHKYTYFVTLTYAPKYLPTFSVSYDIERRGYVYYNHCERTAPLGEFYFNSVLNYSSSKLHSLLDKCQLNGRLSYTSVRDVQLFLKRLRKHLYLQGINEKIRYYVVAEYGPVHFRAHYHLLLWFDEQETLSAMPQSICKAWKYGRIDYSLSRGGCANYCASYVNSVNSLPEIFKTCETKPFSRHSKFLAQKLDESQYEEIYDNDLRAVIEKRVVLNSADISVYPTRSFKNRFFPKCRGFADKTFGELYRTYTLFSTAQHYYAPYFQEPPSLSDLAYIIWIDNNSPFNYLFFQHGYNYDVLLRELVFSYRFLKRNCKYHSPRFVLTKIVEFYKFLDYENLKKQYENQSILMDETNCDVELLNLFYDDTYNFDYLKDKPIYQNFYTDTLVKSERKIKHKRLNDLNKIHFN